MRRIAQTRRGFSVIVALAMLSVVAAALASLSVHLRGQAMRTAVLTDAAELRQLLHAGAMAAPALVALDPYDRRSPEPQPRVLALPLPQPLADRGARVRLTSVPRKVDLEREVTIEATLGGAAATQVLRFIRTRERWAIIEAILHPPRDEE